MTKRQRKRKTAYTIIATLLAGFSLSSFLGGSAGKFARADVQEAAPEKYESRSVLDDLSGMTVDGKEFTLSDYPENAQDSPRILAFTEYCYAYRSDMRGYYGLYIYLYNPQQIAFECTSGKNKLEMRCGDSSEQSFNKYDLQLLDVTTQSGYENRFYKFKVAFTAEQRAEVLAALNPESRVYSLSGVELLDPNWKGYPNAHDYPIGGVDEDGNPRGITYTYTGYAKGYGKQGTSETTLSCKAEGLETVSLEAHHTTYRPKGTAYSEGYKSKTVRNSLSSVYFAVPKTLRNNYDDLHSVHATWLEAETAPMLVTGNKDVYDNLLQFVGDSAKIYGSDYNHLILNELDTACRINKQIYNAGLKYLLTSYDGTLNGWGEVPLNYSGNSYFQGFFDTAITSLGIRWEYSDYKDYFYQPDYGVNKHHYIISNSDERYCGRSVDQLNWLFYAPGGVDGADRYCVPSAELYNWAYKTFAEITNGIGFDYYKVSEHENGAGDPWAAEFARIVYSKAELNRGNGIYLPLLDRLAKEYRTEKIESTIEYSITSNEWVTTIEGWGFIKWLETNLVEMPPKDNIKAVYEVTDKDFESNDKTAVCENLLISELDYEDFKAYYEANKENNRIYLFRFDDESEYISAELAEFDISGSTAKKIDTNAYFCKEKIYLDFDIIDVTVTKDGEQYVIGCVMSPIDIFPSTTPPPITTSDMPDWWLTALITEIVLVGALVGVVLVKRFIRGRFGK